MRVQLPPGNAENAKNHALMKLESGSGGPDRHRGTVSPGEHGVSLRTGVQRAMDPHSGLIQLIRNSFETFETMFRHQFRLMFPPWIFDISYNLFLKKIDKISKTAKATIFLRPAPFAQIRPHKGLDAPFLRPHSRLTFPSPTYLPQNAKKAK